MTMDHDMTTAGRSDAPAVAPVVPPLAPLTMPVQDFARHPQAGPTRRMNLSLIHI